MLLSAYRVQKILQFQHGFRVFKQNHNLNYINNSHFDFSFIKRYKRIKLKLESSFHVFGSNMNTEIEMDLFCVKVKDFI